MVTTIALPVDLHRKLLIAAVEENAAFTELIRSILSKWIERRENKGRRK